MPGKPRFNMPGVCRSMLFNAATIANLASTRQQIFSMIWRVLVGRCSNYSAACMAKC